MHLCILDSLSELASFLTAVLILPKFTEHPLGPDQLGVVVPVQTIVRVHVLELLFSLEYQVPFWHHKPSEFMPHPITGLSSGPQNLGWGVGMFKVMVYLTPDGFEEYRNIILATHQRKEVVKQFLIFYVAESPRWDNITDLASSLSWTELVSRSTADFFESRHIGKNYVREIVEASTRVNYGQNVDVIHALEGAVSMAAGDMAAIQGGNYQMFGVFIRASNA
ncbi:uncharacterized protein ARMOST_20304 [Armillaria ostoyae]|uniref:Prenylcysteine lyase domain-containing protein n=1 Tax=Armillaria ostoyae TaxID=47428 RepID=A0A284S6Z6_ARMOS|nr:uncharacterized protein ARMOST_20304 [Armillaria ostoyae]